MRVIITGGTGLIGRALSAHLVGDDYEVFVLSRSPDRAPPMPEGVRLVQWDARTAEGWGGLADGTDAIVNLAGATLNRLWTDRYKGVIRDSRLDAGRAVVAAVAQAENEPGVVVQASGTGYYGPRGDEVVTERTEPGDGYLGQTAVAWEASTAPVEELGVRRAIIRSGLVLSTEGGALPVMMLPFRFFLGGPLGSGRQWWPWVHIADEVRALRFLIEEEEAHGPFNLTAPHPATSAQFSQALGQAMGRPAWVPVPPFILRLVMGQMSTVVLSGQRAIPERLSGLGFTFQFRRLEAALRDLM